MLSLTSRSPPFLKMTLSLDTAFGERLACDADVRQTLSLARVLLAQQISSNFVVGYSPWVANSPPTWFGQPRLNAECYSERPGWVQVGSDLHLLVP